MVVGCSQEQCHGGQQRPGELVGWKCWLAKNCLPLSLFARLVGWSTWLVRLLVELPKMRLLPLVGLLACWHMTGL